MVLVYDADSHFPDGETNSAHKPRRAPKITLGYIKCCGRVFGLLRRIWDVLGSNIFPENTIITEVIRDFSQIL
jgi:hypothetical protein